MDMRVNQKSAAHALPAGSNKLSKVAQRCFAPYQPRQAAENEAQPNRINVMELPKYTPGDGDTPAFVRPGSLHRHPSRGFKT